MSTMEKLDRTNLWTLEEYAEARPTFREEVMAHKTHRRVALGPHATLYFEDFLTMKYQVQEMLRAERIFEPREIDEEIEAYNPLIPDGRNWKATFMIEYPDEDERRRRLAELGGIEEKVWVRIAGFDPVFAIANEDLSRTTEEKTSAVHFMRFELSEEMASAVKGGADIAMGIDHAGLGYTVDPIAADVRDALAQDLA
jgi:hypothetical protein